MANAKRRTPEFHNNTTAEEDWEKNQKTNTASARNIIPHENHKKEEKNQTPIWAKKAKQWSTKEEWGRMQQHLEERNQLQKQLTKIDQTIRRQQQKITLIKMISAWKQATTYLINNKNT